MKINWPEFGQLIKECVLNLGCPITLDVDDIIMRTGATGDQKAVATWNRYQAGYAGFDGFTRHGLEVHFQPEQPGNAVVQSVTFSIKSTEGG